MGAGGGPCHVALFLVSLVLCTVHCLGVDAVREAGAWARRSARTREEFVGKAKASSWRPAAAAQRVGLWGGGIALPSPPNSGFYTPLQQIFNRGPCTGTDNPINVSVRTESDFNLRLQYPPTSTVLVEVQRSVSLRAGLVFGGNYSCTIIRAAQGKSVLLYTRVSAQPLLTIYNASNILMSGISMTHGVNTQSPPCSSAYFTKATGADTPTLTCPGLHIANSFGIQVANGTLHGRIDVFRSMFVRLDSLLISSANVYDTNAPYRSNVTRGLIRMGRSDLGPTFVASNNVISNCHLNNAWELVSLYQGAVGVTVRNNFFDRFYFTAVRCGAGTLNSFDCHSNWIGFNRMFIPPGWHSSELVDPKNSGIYAEIHWFNPGNFLTCNYIQNTIVGIFLDSDSSGVTVQGGVSYFSQVGVMINNGKYNTITSYIVALSYSVLSQTTCSFAQSLTFPASAETRTWEGVRRTYYDTADINSAYPYMATIADPVPTTVNGVNCNLPGGLTSQQTGNCSGVPYANHVEAFAYKPPPKPWKNNTIMPYSDCESIPSTGHINYRKWYDVSAPKYRFINPKEVRFGVKEGSVLLKRWPNFTVCQRQYTGPKGVNLKSYQQSFNIPVPSVFNAMLSFVSPSPVQVSG